MCPSPIFIAAAETNGVCSRIRIWGLQVILWVGEEVIERELKVASMARKWELVPIKEVFGRFG